MQIKAVNMVAGLKGRTYEDKCKELGLDTLECRRNKQDLLQAYKIFKGKDKVDPDLLFTRVGAAHTTRATRFTADPMNIVEERSRLDIRKYSYAVRVASEWNKLKPDTKTSQTVPIFKNALKNHFNPTGRMVEDRRS